MASLTTRRRGCLRWNLTQLDLHIMPSCPTQSMLRLWVAAHNEQSPPIPSRIQIGGQPVVTRHELAFRPASRARLIPRRRVTQCDNLTVRRVTTIKKRHVRNISTIRRSPRYAGFIVAKIRDNQCHCPHKQGRKETNSRSGGDQYFSDARHVSPTAPASSPPAQPPARQRISPTLQCASRLADGSRTNWRNRSAGSR